MFIDIMDVEFRKHFEEEQLKPVDATPTPLPLWNNMCRDDGGGVGIARGWFIVIGGNPKFGKSIFALNMAASAMQAGRAVCFVSLEMPIRALAARFYATMTKTPIYELEKGGFKKEHFDAVWKQMAPTANEYSFAVNDTPITSTSEVLDGMNAAVDEGYSYFIVDYLQLMGLGDDAEINRQVTTATTNLRHFARSTNSTVVVLSQFNRETAKNYDDTPQVQGLHGGMIVEASADQIFLLDHSRYKKAEGHKYSHLAMTYGVLTNRHGMGGDIPIEWDYSTLSVREGNDQEVAERWPE